MNEQAAQACRSVTPVPDTMFPAPGAISDGERLDGVRMSMIAARKTFAEHWALDPTGNWTGYKQDTDGGGAWDLDQTRTHNAANEITAFAGTTWAATVHDRAGNMTTVPKPDSPSSSYTCVYDAWNRLVRVRDGQNNVAEYEYDGRNFRVVKKTYAAGVFSEVRHFYYTNDWQVLEERIEASPIPNPQSLRPSTSGASVTSTTLSSATATPTPTACSTNGSTPCKMPTGTSSPWPTPPAKSSSVIATRPMVRQHSSTRSTSLAPHPSTIGTYFTAATAGTIIRRNTKSVIATYGRIWDAGIEEILWGTRAIGTYIPMLITEYWIIPMLWGSKQNVRCLLGT